MSMGTYNDRNPYYADGITKIVDPFWHVTCTCGHTFLSCISNGKCPKCGSAGGVRTLGDKTFEEVVAERGEPKPID
jgi:hypothetical protein